MWKGQEERTTWKHEYDGELHAIKSDVEQDSEVFYILPVNELRCETFRDKYNQ